MPSYDTTYFDPPAPGDQVMLPTQTVERRSPTCCYSWMQGQTLPCYPVLLSSNSGP